MSIIDEIQSDLIDPEIKISTTLRKAKVLAYKIGNKDLKTWIAKEINGYDFNDEIPDYRIVHTQSYGNFSGPFGANIRNANIPPSCLPKEAKDYPIRFTFIQGVSGLESIVEENEPDLKFPWPADNVVAISADIYEGYVCMQAWWHISSHQIYQLLENIRNKLLSFVLELGELDIPSDPKNISEEEGKEISTMFRTFIFGNNNQIGIGPANNITKVIVSKGDIKSLKEALELLEVPEKEIDNLESAIKIDGKRNEQDGFGPKVKEWLGKGIQEISKGAWKIGIDVLSKTIVTYLNSFFGWG